MIHVFDVDVAKELGLNCAIIFQNISFWVEKNRANEKHYHDGRYWTYSSVKAFSELFPYLTARQIRTALDKLEESGALITGNYNSSPYDRTKWYALGDYGESLCHRSQSHLTPVSNQSDRDVKPVPDVAPDLSTDMFMGQTPKKSNAPQRKKSSKPFIPPTLEEVKAYVKEQGYHFDPELFWATNERDGWVTGKKDKLMENWKAACRVWEVNELKWHPELNKPKPKRYKLVVDPVFDPMKALMGTDQHLEEIVED